MPPVATQRLFYSYSSRDEQARQQLETHLSLLKREDVISTWSFRDIEAGIEWKRAIDRKLEEASIILLLVSANFVASDYCWDIEMARALERHDCGDAIVIPIILKPCDWATAPFARLQVLPEGAKSVDKWRPRDRGWQNVVAGIRRRIASSQANDSSGVLSAPVKANNQTSVFQIPTVISSNPSPRTHVISARPQSKLLTDARRYLAAIEESITIFAAIEVAILNARSALLGREVSVAWHDNECVARVGRLSLVVRLYATPGLTQHLNVYFYFGRVAVPNENAYMPNQVTHSDFEYRFGYKDDVRDWYRRDSERHRITSLQLVEFCVGTLLQLHDDVEAGRVAVPRNAWP